MNTPEAAFLEFIAAFNALDWVRFAQGLASDVSLFAPESPHPLGRMDGRPVVEAHFKTVFAAEGPGGPGIKPTNVCIQPLGEVVALVTFEFARAGGSIGRRTVVFQHGPEGWKVVHVHASNTRSTHLE